MNRVTCSFSRNNRSNGPAKLLLSVGVQGTFLEFSPIDLIPIREHGPICVIPIRFHVSLQIIERILMWTFRIHWALGLVTLLIVGCESKTESKEPIVAPLSGVTLTVSLPETPNVASAWRQSADEWQERTAATAELETATGKGLQIIRIVDIPDLSAEKKLKPVSQDLMDEAGNGLWSDIPRGLRQSLCVRRREQAALIPLSCPVLVCYYRADLLKTAGLRPPKTWSEYHRLAKTASKWAPGLSVVEPWSEDFRATMFLARAVSYARFPGNYSLCFDIHSGKPLIAEEGFVKALEESVMAISGMADDVLKMSPTDCSEQVRTGKAAMAIGYEPLGTKVERDSGAVIGFATLPGQETVFDRSEGEWKLTPDRTINRPTLTAFTGYCAVFSPDMDEKQQRAASNFIATITDRDEFGVAAFPAELRSLCRMSHESLGEQWYSQQLIGDESRNYSQTVINALESTEVVSELPIMGRKQFRDKLTIAISRTLDNSMSAAESLKQLSNEWKAITRELGESAVNNSYRASFGFSPK